METLVPTKIKNTIDLKCPIPGPIGQGILARRAAALPTGAAKSTEVVVESAKGAVVKDVDGNTLLDFAGGIGMINVGHSPQNVLNAMKKQMDKFIHTCQIVTTFEAPIQLAEMLNALTPGDFPKKTLFSNSGSEAVENAVNMAKYFTQRPAVIAFEGAYHGRTTLTMSLTSKYNFVQKRLWLDVTRYLPFADSKYVPNARRYDGKAVFKIPFGRLGRCHDFASGPLSSGGYFD
jgi:4-aminobutyrate aminotransferase / (S)-3-amino-2-methylpropionate transaminase / 5-aminovalerate transaminase